MGDRQFYCMSDIHSHIFSQFDSPLSEPSWGTYSTRLFHCLISMIHVFDEALAEDRPVVVIPGDVFHIRGKILVEVFNAVLGVFKWAVSQGVEIFVIPGNHDFAYYDRPVHALEGLSQVGVRVITTSYIPFDSNLKNVMFVGLPYSVNEEEVREKLRHVGKEESYKALTVGLFHCQIKGIAFESGFTSQEGISRKVFPKNLNLILNGHHHTPKKLSKRFINVGSLLGHSFSDANSPRGYWKIKIDGKRCIPIFKQNRLVPSFVDVDMFHSDLLTEHISGNYIRLTNVNPLQLKETEQFLQKHQAAGVVTSLRSIQYQIMEEQNNEIEFKPFDNLVTLFENYMVLREVKKEKRRRLLTLVESLMGE